MGPHETGTIVLNEILIQAKALRRDYAGMPAVSGVSFELRRGQVLGFLGANGAGKSTTLRMLTGNLAPTAGEVRVGGYVLQDQPIPAKAMIGYLPEHPPLYPELTVGEYLGYAARLRRVPVPAVAEAVDLACQRCDLLGHRRQLIRHLSKGFQQRVGIAQAIVHNPAVVVLDEPSVGLDPIQIRGIRRLIRSLGRDHGVILSSHLLGEIQAVCSHVLIIHAGRSVYAADLADMDQPSAGTTLVLHLAAPPTVEALRQLDGVTAAESLGDGRFRLSHSSGDAGAEAMVHAACEHGWRLTAIQTESRSLEQVFVELTLGAEAHAA